MIGEKKLHIVYLGLVVAMASCMEKKQEGASLDAVRAELLATDRAFSQKSEMEGMNAAFIEYIDSNVVLLRPGSLPIVGADALDFFLMQDDSSFTMNWQPQKAEVAESKDMGYTYGVYAIHPKEVDTVIYGTYINIWKKQKDGEWKVALETANDGIGTPQE